MLRSDTLIVGRVEVYNTFILIEVTDGWVPLPQFISNNKKVKIHTLYYIDRFVIDDKKEMIYYIFVDYDCQITHFCWSSS